MWKHTESNDSLVRTTSFSLPRNLREHVDVIQPTTMFTRWKGMKSNLVWDDATEQKSTLNALAPISNVASGTTVDRSCNVSITITCLQQLYNAVGYQPKATNKNGIGIIGYLEEFANIQDLQSFYADQRPDALNSSFKFVSVKGLPLLILRTTFSHCLFFIGGLNSQNLSEAGAEANLDVQFAFGLSYPTPGTFWSTAGRPPFNPDLGTPTNTNEPYADVRSYLIYCDWFLNDALQWLDYVLSQPNPPQSISTSYGDHEQTGQYIYLFYAALFTTHMTSPRELCSPCMCRICSTWCVAFASLFSLLTVHAMTLGVRGVSLLFSSGDGGVGDANPDPATQQCQTNDGRNVTRFIPSFPATCPLRVQPMPLY